MKKALLIPLFLFLTFSLKKVSAQKNSTVDVTVTPSSDQSTEKESRLTAAYLAQKYNDKTLQNVLYNLQQFREQQIAEVYKKNVGSDKLDVQLTAVIARFDSLQESLLHAAKANMFVKNKIEELNAIKPLGVHTAAKLEALFRQNCLKRNKNALADIFSEVLHRIVKDTTYYAALFKDEINFQASTNAKRLAYNIFRDNKLTPEGYNSLLPIVLAKERALATINYTLPVYNSYKDSISSMTTNYYDSLISICLMKDGVFKNVSLYSIAVKNRSKLALRKGQVDTLLEKAVALDNVRKDYMIKNPLGKFDSSPYEVQNIQNVLNEDQYLQLLSIKNKPQAEEWAKGDWAELKQRGIVNGLDSLSVIYEITRYNTNRLVVKERYANDKVKQNSQIQSIDDTMPTALRRLKNARIGRGTTGSTSASNGNSTKPTQSVTASFQW